MDNLKRLQREGREAFRQDFTSDCEGYIDCIKGQLDKLDQHTAATWKAAQESKEKEIAEDLNVALELQKEIKLDAPPQYEQNSYNVGWRTAIINFQSGIRKFGK